jgi:hypothetical protein
MNIADFTARFHKIELERALFSFKSDNGIKIWDPVRFHVFHYIYSQLSGGEYIYGTNTVKPSILKKVLKKLVGSVAKWRLYIECWVNKKQYLQIMCSREKRNNSFIDPIQTQLSLDVQDNSLRLETSILKNSMTHSKFLITPNNFVMDQVTHDFIHTVENAFLLEFQIDIRLGYIFLDALSEFNAQYNFYRTLFKWTNFKSVFVVQNGIMKGMFYAAKEFSIPVYEFQHGYIGYTHLAYSYPRLERIVENVYLPNMLLTYADFWQFDSYMPGVKMLTIGSKNHEGVKLSNEKNIIHNVLVTSSILHHENLASLLKIIANKLDTIFFVYKLHPNQFVNMQVIVNEFEAFPNVEVISYKKNMQQCLSGCRTMVCVQTTAVYEALQSGVFVCCYNRQDCNFHNNAADIDGFSFFDNATELLKLIEENKNKQMAIIPKFFSEYNSENCKSILDME